MQSGKVILITGSSRGIGAELAKRFAADNHKVIINYAASEAAAHELCGEIADQVGNDRVMAVKADVAQRDAVRNMFEQAVGVFGQIDVLVNNAGLNVDRPFLDMTDSEWDRVIATSLTGTFVCSQEFARHYRGENGHIVNMAASTAFRGRKNGANYCSAKAGVVTLTKCMALELAPRIAVNCIVPGSINTEELMVRYNLYEKENYDRMVSTIPMGRLGTPADIYTMVRFLVTESVYITGQNFFVNGGNFM